MVVPIFCEYKKFMRTLAITSGVIALTVAILLGAWIYAFKLWPIACSTRGCITKAEWVQQRAYDIAFAQATRKDQPSDTTTLTTVIRRHLISHAVLQSPVSSQDAVRYRTAILHTTDIATLKPLGITSFSIYDSQIILPFLQQEALMKQKNITNTEVLYKELASQRKIFLLLFHYRWNIDRGEVEAK